MTPIQYLSGYCAGRLDPTPRPLGVGARIPERKPIYAARDQSKLPSLPWALARHGIDPRVLEQEED